MGLHPVRPVPGRDRRSTWARSRSAARSPTRASSGATSSSRSPAATRSTTPTRSSRCSGSPASRSPTSTTGARPRRARSTLAANTIRLGDHELGIAVGMDKHLPGAFSADPRLYACPSWYGEVGQFVTTKFFGMKINKYMHDHGISHETLARVVGQELSQRRAEPERVPAQADVGGRDPRIADAQLPAHAVHVLQPRRRRRGRRAVPRRARAPVHRQADLPAAPRRCGPAGSARSRCTARGSRSSRPSGPTVDASRAAYEMAGIGPEDVDVIQLQDTDAGAEVIHLAENGFCADGDQERARRRRRARDRRRAAGQHRRRPHRERRADRRVGPAPGARGRAATPRPGRRAPGARQPEGRLHAALRRARHRRRVDHVDLSVPAIGRTSAEKSAVSKFGVHPQKMPVGSLSIASRSWSTGPASVRS